MHTFVFTKFAKKRFIKLDQVIQRRIILKLKELKKHRDIDAVLRQLHHVEPATHRLRIGDYRLILCKEGKRQFLILDVGHRSDVYR